MLPEVNMIHMNGRVYEPTLGQFMSADPYVQFAGFSQSYNRYSYGFNNPFAGWAVSSYLSGYDVYLAGGAQREIKKSWLISVGTAAAFYGVGSATEAVGTVYGEGAAFAFNVAGHAAVGCASASVGRGNCGQGALSAGFGAAAGAINTGNGFGNFLVAAVAGGIGAELGGGKFANGAVTGAFGYLFNQALHYNKQTDTLIVNKTVTLYHMTGEPPVIQWSGTIEWRTEIPIDALLERGAGPIC